jgi:IclR family acetate operon transcriptional repressor
MDKVSIPASERDSAAASNASGTAKALVKGLALVELVSGADAPVRLSELVAGSGLPRPTVLRLLEVLLEQGVLQPAAEGAFALGPRLALWGQRYLDGLDVRAHAEDLMRALAEQTRETCFLGIRDDRSVLYIAKADSPQAVRPAAGVGARNPLHSTGLGKALLAFAPPGVAAAYADHGSLEAKTPDTIVDPRHFAAELERTRERGYAIDDVENEDGVRCVAAPIRDHAGVVIAALSVSAPAYRFALEDLPALAPDVVAVAVEISSRIGFREPAANETSGGRPE